MSDTGGLPTAFRCFVGAWGFLNATLTNQTTGELVPEWHSTYPSGMSIYTNYGVSYYNNFIITANDSTQAAVRPTELTLPAKPTDLDSTWALVGQHSLAAGGPIRLSEAKAEWGHGPSGILVNQFTTATLPSWVGRNFTNAYEFFDSCNVHVLRAFFGDLVQTVYFYRLHEKDYKITETQ